MDGQEYVVCLYISHILHNTHICVNVSFVFTFLRFYTSGYITDFNCACCIYLAAGYVVRNNDPQGWILPNPPPILSIRDMHNTAWWDVTYQNDFLYGAVSQWFVDMGIFNCDNLPQPDQPGGIITPPGGRGTARGRHLEYADATWEFLTYEMNANNRTISQPQAEALYGSLAQITCEARQGYGGGVPCERPKCFDDCSDLIPCDDDSGGDIDVTLDELIEKVQGYPCMIRTRREYYEWAKFNGDLLGLCRGDYDNFCDRAYIEGESSLDSCPVTETYAEAALETYAAAEEDGGGGEYIVSGYGAQSGLFAMDDHDGFETHDRIKGYKFDYNTLAIVVVLVFNVIGCVYLDNKWKRKLQKEGMKYVDQDDI